MWKTLFENRLLIIINPQKLLPFVFLSFFPSFLLCVSASWRLGVKYFFISFGELQSSVHCFALYGSPQSQTSHMNSNFSQRPITAE